MDNKKTKLTISGSPKKSFKNLDSSKAKGKKTVIIVSHKLELLKNCDKIFKFENGKMIKRRI